MKYVLFVFSLLLLASCNHQQSIVDDLRNKLDSMTESNAQLMKKFDSSSLMHTVYFWMKEDITDTETKHFEKWVKTLKTCPTLGRFRMGSPAPTEQRGVIDNSFSYAINVEFSDIEAHDAYQVDPIHLKFIEECKDLWTKVIVYDNHIN